MTEIQGLVFANAWRRAERFDFEDLSAPVLCEDDVILAKQTSNRPEDRIAVRRLKLARKSSRARDKGKS